MVTKITVDKIEIAIGGTTLSLTPDELQELRDVLDATFPRATWIPSRPIIDWPVYPGPWRHWEPTWCNSAIVNDSGSSTMRIESKS